MKDVLNAPHDRFFLESLKVGQPGDVERCVQHFMAQGFSEAGLLGKRPGCKDDFSIVRVILSP